MSEGHYKLVIGGEVMARGDYPTMVGDQNMHRTVKNGAGKETKTWGGGSIEADTRDYPFRGNDAPKISLGYVAGKVFGPIK